MRIAVMQHRASVGGFEANIHAVRDAYAAATEGKAGLLVTPELFLTGYPPEDLLLREGFLRAAEEAAGRAAALTAGGEAALLFGGVYRDAGGLYNAAFLAENGAITRIFRKRALPNYGVFDEKRYFIPGDAPQTAVIAGHTVRVLICEDMWQDDATDAPQENTALTIVLNASPFEKGKSARREARASALARQTGAPVLYAQLTGGQDEIVFDGGSFAVDAAGSVTARLPYFAEETATLTLNGSGEGAALAGAIAPVPDARRLLYDAVKTGLRDYVRGNGFHSVILGLSGGADSAFTAALAADAFGPENVGCFYLPSPYSSGESEKDAYDCAANIGVHCETLDIAGLMHAADGALGALVTAEHGLARENIQPRLRGMLLMAVSNAAGALLLTTGNKSECAVGYCTLYGDMCGAFNPVKDLYKTELYKLCRYYNDVLRPDAPVPENILTKAPTAELRPEQKDSDSLPPYPVLDGMLRALLEERLSVEEIAARGFDLAEVKRIRRLVVTAEYKRRQAAPGTKLSPLAFGRERRYPMTQDYTG